MEVRLPGNLWITSRLSAVTGLPKATHVTDFVSYLQHREDGRERPKSGSGMGRSGVGSSENAESCRNSSNNAALCVCGVFSEGGESRRMGAPRRPVRRGSFC